LPSRQYGITIFATLIYFAGQTTSAVNLSLIAISIPLFIMVLSRIAFKEKVSAQNDWYSNNHIGSFNTNYKGSLQSLLHIRFTTGDLLMLIASFSSQVIPF
jgi:hypothetical protein